MPQDRLISEFKTLPDGHVLIPATTPERLCKQIGEILSSTTLPPPFPVGTSPRVVAYESILTREEKPAPKLPTITWRVIHTFANPKRPKEVFTRKEPTMARSSVDVFQQDFHHTVQFDVYAQTQEEAGTLLWWLIDQLMLYRSVIADLGAQHLRLSESRSDFLEGVPGNKYPCRSVRYTVETSRIYRIPRAVLTSITLTMCDPLTAVYAEESLVKGVDLLTYPYVAQILAVTSEDGEITYTPYYDSANQQLQWAPELLQPQEGTSYKVAYLYYGGTTSTTACVPSE